MLKKAIDAEGFGVGGVKNLTMTQIRFYAEASAYETELMYGED